jgi:chaperonin GroES
MADVMEYAEKWRAALEPNDPYEAWIMTPTFTNDPNTPVKFKPLHDRVLIEVLDSSEKTAGGIIIPDTAQEKPQEGKVVAVGGGAKTEDGKVIPMDVKVGDKVLFGKWSGTEVKIDGKEFSIMKESDIMGISNSK